MAAVAWYNNEVNKETKLVSRLRRYHENRESPLVLKVKESTLPCYILNLDDELLLWIFIHVSQEDLLALSHVCLRFFRVSRSVMKLCIQHQTWQLDPAMFLHHTNSNIPHADADHTDSDADRTDDDDDDDDDDEEDAHSVMSTFRNITTHDEPSPPQVSLVVRYMRLRAAAAHAAEPVFRPLTGPAAFIHTQNVLLMGVLLPIDWKLRSKSDGSRFMTLPFASHAQYQQWTPTLPARLEEWRTAYPRAGTTVVAELTMHHYSKHFLTVGFSWLFFKGLLFLQDRHPNLRFSPATAAAVQALPEVLARVILYPLELATNRLWSMLAFSSIRECGDLMLTCSTNRPSLSLVNKLFNRHAETTEVRYQRRWSFAIVGQVLRESPVSPWSGLSLALLETFGIEAGGFYLASRANGIKSFKPADIFCYQPSCNFYKFCLQPLRCFLTPLRLRSATEGVPGRPEQPQRPSSENIVLNPFSLTNYIFESLDPVLHLKALLTTVLNPANILFVFSDTLFRAASGAYRRHYG